MTGETLQQNDSWDPERKEPPLAAHFQREDIQQQTQDDALASSSEKWLQPAVNAVHPGVWKYSTQQNTVYWDEQTQAIFGAKVKGPISYEEALAHVHPEDYERSVQLAEGAVAPESNGEFTIEKRIIRPDGAVRWVLVNGKAIFEESGSDRQATQLVGTVQDITERKLREMEERFRVALKHTPIVVWHQDQQLRYRWIYNSQLGYRDEDVMGKRDVDLMERREDAERVEALKRRVLESGVGTVEEVTIARGDEVAHYELTIEPLQDNEGQVVGITCAAYDITERKRTEAEREQLLATLHALNETLEERVEKRAEQVHVLSRSLAQAEQRERLRIAQVLHDNVQQMLAAVHMQLQLIGDEIPARAQSQLAEIKTLVSEVSKMTRSLAAELAAPVLENDDLATIFAWLATLMAKQYQLQVTVVGPENCRVADRQIRELLFQSVRELLFNVVKHANTNRAEVRLMEKEGQVIVEVRDEGVGFDPDAMPTVPAEDTGLGLPSVQQRLAIAGGRLEIHSQPGSGTRIRLAFPTET